MFGGNGEVSELLTPVSLCMVLYENVSTIVCQTMEEKQLIEALRQHDPDAFRLMYDKYHQRLEYLSYGIVHNTQDAEDIVQEVFIDVYDSIDKFREESKLSTWLHRITLNKSYNFLRYKRVHDIFVKVEATLLQKPEKEEDNSENDEKIADLHKAIAALPRRQNMVFTMFFYEKMPQKEIAEIVGIAVPAVEQLIFRAKQNIRKTMNSETKKKGDNVIWMFIM